MVQAPWTGIQSPTCPGPANSILLPSSLACSPVPPCRCLCHERPSRIPLFLGLFSFLEALLTVRKVRAQPRMDLCILCLRVCSGHTPAAAVAHAHVCGVYAGSHTIFPSILPLGELQLALRGCPGISPLPKASAGTVSGIQEVAMATAGPSVPSPAISTGTWPPAGLPGDLFPVIGSCAGVCVGGPNLPLLFSPVLPSLAPSMAGLPGWTV